jgi:predicted transcriptional regulator
MNTHSIAPEFDSFEAYADIFMKNIGKKLRRMREKKEIKFEHIYQSTGIKFESVKLIEDGKDVHLSTFLKYQLFLQNQ